MVPSFKTLHGQGKEEECQGVRISGVNQRELSYGKEWLEHIRVRELWSSYGHATESCPQAEELFLGSLERDHCKIRGEGHGQPAPKTHKEQMRETLCIEADWHFPLAHYVIGKDRAHRILSWSTVQFFSQVINMGDFLLFDLSSIFFRLRNINLAEKE